MYRENSTAVSISCLSWINQELRKEVEQRRVVEAKVNSVMRLAKSYLVAGASGLALIVLKILDI